MSILSHQGRLTLVGIFRYVAIYHRAIYPKEILDEREVRNQIWKLLKRNMLFVDYEDGRAIYRIGKDFDMPSVDTLYNLNEIRYETR